jgi:hypothetical protein
MKLFLLIVKREKKVGEEHWGEGRYRAEDLVREFGV